MPKPDHQPPSWGKMQFRWGFILADLSSADRDAFIRDITDAEDDFATYTLLIALKFRFDCPELVFELLDEIHALQKRRAPKEDFRIWGEAARASLRRYIGDDEPVAPSPLLH